MKYDFDDFQFDDFVDLDPDPDSSNIFTGLIESGSTSYFLPMKYASIFFSQHFRIFIGNIPSDVHQSDLENRFTKVRPALKTITLELYYSCQADLKKDIIGLMFINV